MLPPGLVQGASWLWGCSASLGRVVKCGTFAHTPFGSSLLQSAVSSLPLLSRAEAAGTGQLPALNKF